MAVERRIPSNGQKRQDSKSYRAEAPGGSLASRIGAAPALSRKASNGPQKHQAPPRLPANPDNPLYAYINGQKPAKSRTVSPYSRPKERAEPAHERQALTKSTNDLSIKGQGAALNTFSIRGASSTSVSIKNLAPGTNPADVCTILNAQIGEVEDCVTFSVSGGLSTTAEVKFGSRIAADKAINLLHGVLADNKRLNVTILLENIQPAQAKPTSQKASTGKVSEDTDMMDVKPAIRHEKTHQDYRGKGQDQVRGKGDLFQNRMKNNHAQHDGNKPAAPKPQRALSNRY